MSRRDAQELLRGVTDSLLLSLVGELPTYGYQLIKELERRSGGYFKVRGGTIYPVLRRLEKAELISSHWQQITKRQRRRYYQVTEKGRQVLAERLAEWQDFYSAASKLMSLDCQ